MTSSENPQFLFLVGAPRSANSAVHALLDSHPGILTWPVECHFFTVFKQVAGESKTAPVKELNKRFIEHFVDRFRERLSLNTVQLNDNVFQISNMFSGFDIPKFIKELESNASDQMTALEYLTFVFSSFHQCSNQYKNTKVRYYSMLLTSRGFDWTNPDVLKHSRLIFPYRPSIESYGSLRENYLKTITPNEFFHINAKKGMLYWMNTYKKISDHANKYNNHSNFHVLKVSDLRTNQEKTVNKLYKFLNIKQHNSMNTMTILGLPYGGNARDASLNTGRIAKKPSTLLYPISRFERHCFQKIKLHDFDNDQTIFIPHSTLRMVSLAIYSSLWEIKSKFKENHYNTPSRLKFIHWRIKLLIKFLKIQNILQNEDTLKSFSDKHGNPMDSFG